MALVTEPQAARYTKIQEIHDVHPLLNSFDEWIMVFKDVRIFVLPKGDAPKSSKLKACIDNGRWIVRCPDCHGAELVSRKWKKFYCISCSNSEHGHKIRPVQFPKNADRIEETLLKRPHHDFMYWEPGQTIRQLKSKKEFHRSWTAPRTWVTGELVTASIMNVHIKENLLETAPEMITQEGELIVGAGDHELEAVNLGDGVIRKDGTTFTVIQFPIRTASIGIAQITESRIAEDAVTRDRVADRSINNSKIELNTILLANLSQEVRSLIEEGVWRVTLNLEYREPQAGVNPQFHFVVIRGNEGFIEFSHLTNDDIDLVQSMQEDDAIEIENRVFNVQSYSRNADNHRLRGTWEDSAPPLNDETSYDVRFSRARPEPGVTLFTSDNPPSMSDGENGDVWIEY